VDGRLAALRNKYEEEGGDETPPFFGGKRKTERVGKDLK